MYKDLVLVFNFVLFLFVTGFCFVLGRTPQGRKASGLNKIMSQLYQGLLSYVIRGVRNHAFDIHQMLSAVLCAFIYPPNVMCFFQPHLSQTKTDEKQSYLGETLYWALSSMFKLLDLRESKGTQCCCALHTQRTRISEVLTWLGVFWHGAEMTMAPSYSTGVRQVLCPSSICQRCSQYFLYRISPYPCHSSRVEALVCSRFWRTSSSWWNTVTLPCQPRYGFAPLPCCEI